MKIYISDYFNDALTDTVSQEWELTDNLAEAEVVVVRSKTRCQGSWFEKAPKCHLIIRGGIGLDNINLDEAERRGIEVRNTPGVSSIAVAELTMGLLLAAANSIVYANVSDNGVYPKKAACSRVELYGKTIGLIGYGSIGKRVARMAAGFGMDVIVHDPYVESISFNGYDRETVSLNAVLTQSEFITLHVPLTEETTGLIDDLALFLIEKKCVVLVNTSRAEVVDQEALHKVLESGSKLCYATDVLGVDLTAGEALREDYADRVVITPHIGAQTPENLTRTTDFITEIIHQHAAAAVS